MSLRVVAGLGASDLTKNVQVKTNQQQAVGKALLCSKQLTNFKWKHMRSRFDNWTDRKSSFYLKLDFHTQNENTWEVGLINKQKTQFLLETWLSHCTLSGCSEHMLQRLKRMEDVDGIPRWVADCCYYFLKMYLIFLHIVNDIFFSPWWLTGCKKSFLSDLFFEYCYLANFDYKLFCAFLLCFVIFLLIFNCFF